jgi:riboflavin kinase/FMN adenylyltransferase
VLYKDFVASSSRVRRLLSEGRVDEAAHCLGHPYVIAGTVVRGDGRGRELGMPTANMATENPLLPAMGSTRPGPRWRCLAPAVTSIGVRPTIGDNKLTVETFLLDGTYDLYGTRMQLAFVQWLRDEQKFEDLAALKAQMFKDADQARVVLALAKAD